MRNVGGQFRLWLIDKAKSCPTALASTKWGGLPGDRTLTHWALWKYKCGPEKSQITGCSVKNEWSWSCEEPPFSPFSQPKKHLLVSNLDGKTGGDLRPSETLISRWIIPWSLSSPSLDLEQWDSQLCQSYMFRERKKEEGFISEARFDVL